MEGGVNYLSVENLSKRYGERMIFEQLTFGIAKGQKVGLVARNGSGKTTLLRILMGEETADEGNVTFNNAVKLAFLAQEHRLDEGLTILENLFEDGNETAEAIKHYEALLASGNADERALQRAMDRMDHLDAWNYESNARQILGKLNIHDLNKTVFTMSGGEKRRVALAKALISQPDMILLDEPTNHLDLDMIEWLEAYLAGTNMTLLMVTHDRYFLEVVCDDIIEIDEGQLYRYKGNFSYFLEKKAEREETAFANRDKARNLMRRELEWVRSTPKARTTKSKYRVEQFDVVKQAAGKRLEHDELKLQLNPERLGGKIVEMHRVRKMFGEKVILNGFDYTFIRGEKMGIVGPNGSGKSTFLNILTGKEMPDGGKVVIGETIVFGYYTQQDIPFKDDQRVIEVVKDIAEVIPLKGGHKITAAQMLERFLFPRAMQYQYIGKLSGGERKRLYLLTILMANPNFLILDEPTNDLDIFTLSVLEDYLQDFPGCLVIVSHDRYFMDKLTEHLLVFNAEGNGEVRDLPGNYSRYREHVQEEEARNKLAKEAKARELEAAAHPAVQAETPKKKSFKAKFELEQVTGRLEELGKLKVDLEARLNDPAIAIDELTRISMELGAVMEELDEKELRWLELTDED
jgi:ATP-binding cassette subfamily F protein uup